MNTGKNHGISADKDSVVAVLLHVSFNHRIEKKH
jgi:hypothetical protein